MGRKWGDRKDAKLVRDIDSMHFIMGNVYPNRADNEAYIYETFDLTKIDAYLEKKNAENPEFKYTLFQIIVASFLKCIVLRPKLNRFYANRNYYERNKITTAFVVKKQFSDNGGEGLAFITAEKNWTIEDLHEEMFRQISHEKDGENVSKTEDGMDILCKLPRFISHPLMTFIRFLDRHGWIPASLIAGDPSYSTIFFSNLGSIKLDAGYHHLANWGTTSLFCTVGLKQPRPFVLPDGSTVIRDSVPLGLTVDERIADGYYYSKTIRLLKKLFEHPELLDLPFETEVEDY